MNYRRATKPILAALLLLSLLLGVAVPSVFAASETFNTPGATTWDAPANVREVYCRAWGGGAAGAQRSTNGGGGGGGGGAYTRVYAVPVTPGNTYNYTVGAGGTDGASPTNGGTTTFTGDSGVVCSASGAVTPAAESQTGGAGASTGTGDVVWPGGNGANGDGTLSGGGGEGGGEVAAGENASGVTGGGGGGGAGGNGGVGQTVDANGAPGASTRGGGGGGGFRVTGTRTGGAAGPGQLTLIYYADLAFDVGVESVRTGTTNPHTWTHAPTTTPRGIVVAAIHGDSTTDHCTAGTYGGVALTRVIRATDTATELGAAELWFLGASIPTGAQTVSMTCGTTTEDIELVSISIAASGNTQVVASGSVSEDATDPSVVLAVGGRNSLAVAAIYSGLDAPASLTVLSGMTAVADNDFGAFSSRVDHQTSPSTSDFTIGYTAAADDVAMVAISIAQVSTRGGSLGLMGVGQ